MAASQAGLVGPPEGVTAEEERVEGTVEVERAAEARARAEAERAVEARAVARAVEARAAVEARVEEMTAPRRSPR